MLILYKILRWKNSVLGSTQQASRCCITSVLYRVSELQGCGSQVPRNFGAYSD